MTAANTLRCAALAALGLAPIAAQGPYPALRLWGDMGSTNTHLVDTLGRVVHTWPSAFFPGLAVYLDDDGSLLRTINTGFLLGTYGGAGGGLQRLAFDGSVLWDFRFDTEAGFSHHDIEVLPNGNILMIAWEGYDAATAVAHGRDPLSISNGRFRPYQIIEVQPTGPTSGQIVWQWHVWDHLIQDFDPNQNRFGVVADHPELIDINYPPYGTSSDFNHSNGIDYDADRDWILLSVRNQSEIWIIDHSTTTAEAAGHTGGRWGRGGDLLYRWGNPAAYQRGSLATQQLYWQHGANFIEEGSPGEGNILLFNNLFPGGSRVEELVLPLDATGNLIQPGPAGVYGPQAPTWTYSGNMFSQIVSSARRAPNGNTLICVGQLGVIREVDAAGQTVWSSRNTYGAVYHALYAEHYLFQDRAEISGSAGGNVRLDLVAGSEHAGRPYLMLGSASGTTPGFAFGGATVPLVVDGYTATTISSANTGPFVNTLGLLDAAGRASAMLTLPRGLASLQGLQLHHAYLAFDLPTGLVTRVSNPTSLLFRP